MSTRAGGVSVVPFDTFNLGDHVGDDPIAVASNRKILEAQIGVRPVFMRQVHGTNCVVIDSDTPDGLEADGVVTRAAGVACTVMVADCLPVLFWNESGTVVGAAHAGWRGLVGDGKTNVLQATVHALRGLSQPAEPVHAWLGACIGFENFEVGSEVAVHFDAAYKRAIGAGKWLVDLAGAARQKLAAMGIATVGGNVGQPRENAHWCTVTNERDYFSHRRDSKLSGSTGRMAACIWIDLFGQVKD